MNNTCQKPNEKCGADYGECCQHPSMICTNLDSHYNGKCKALCKPNKESCSLNQYY